MSTRILAAGVTAALVAAVVSASPARAADCQHSYDSNDYLVWGSGCSVAMSPGRAGPLRMGSTTVSVAKKSGFVAYNRFCSRWDGAHAGSDWRSKGGKVVAWATSTTTARGLTQKDSLRRALKLYPSARRTGYMPNAYVDREGWDIYSVANSYGWLDIYSYNNRGSDIAGLFFAVRAKSVKHPVTGWAQDGC